LLAKYREDAFGRRVYAESYWELSRRDVMDTRFGVDVNVDADGDGNAITYLNGGITSTIAPPPGQTDQRTSWDSRIRRNITNANESHYFDFDVTVPSFTGPSTYLGLIAYDRFELRIFSDKYELWDTAGPTLLGDMFPAGGSTLGRHNIGIRAGQGYGVWLNGSQVPNLTAGGSIGLIANPQAKFGAAQYGLTLWENLCYLKSYNRGIDESIPAPGVPVVDTCFFDGPRLTVMREVYVNATNTPVENREDAGCVATKDDGLWQERIELPNGRKHTGAVIAASKDAATYDSAGNRSTLEEPMPGVLLAMHLDAAGSPTLYACTSATALKEWPCFGITTPSFEHGGGDKYFATTTVQGPSGGGSGGTPTFVSTFTAGAASTLDVEIQTDGQSLADEGDCQCRNELVNLATASIGRQDIVFGMGIDHIGGNGMDYNTGVQYCGGMVRPSGIQLFDGEDRVDKLLKKMAEDVRREKEGRKPVENSGFK
nr:hypothetical protein [Planctomycetota bacterium]